MKSVGLSTNGAFFVFSEFRSENGVLAYFFSYSISIPFTLMLQLAFRIFG
jgi:hypothetical protein